VIRLRYPATCGSCGTALAKGTLARWNREEKQAICVGCVAPDAVEEPIDRGVAGGSAAREWQHRHERRERNVRARYGKLGGVVLALSDDPHSTSAWAYGANGERALGRVLDPLRDEGMAVLHDRRIPGSRANIDHLVISPVGVFVVDAKNYKGRVERRTRGGWLSSEDCLYVGGRDRTKLVGGMAKQVDAVRAALTSEFGAIPLVQAICFTDADWSLFARPLRFGNVHVLWPRALGKLLRADGPLTSELIAQVERRLATALLPA
jgi:hypothetical protein